jgi:zinc protease
VEQALRREMAKIIEQGVTAEELERAKAQAVAAHVYQRDSMFFQARQIGWFEISGIPHDTLDLQLQKLREVTPEQVRDVARRYFRDDALNIVTLDPQPLEGRRPAAAFARPPHAR